MSNPNSILAIFGDMESLMQRTDDDAINRQLRLSETVAVVPTETAWNLPKTHPDIAANVDTIPLGAGRFELRVCSKWRIAFYSRMLASMTPEQVAQLVEPHRETIERMLEECMRKKRN
jgi:hypothetical protein